MNAPFSFVGPLPPSKSILIRYLLLQGYAPDLHIPILSACADVRGMQAAMVALRQVVAAQASEPVLVDCGEAGLVLRLCLAYAARRGGRFRLCGSSRLLSRPHVPLLAALAALGSEIEATSGEPINLYSPHGFQPPRTPLSLRGGASSQFASALILNAWDLPFPLAIDIDEEPVSEGYLSMSLHIAEQLGMRVDRTAEGCLHIGPGQRLQPRPVIAEADVSSAFAVAALASVAGRAQITNFPQRSLQPDGRFIELLAGMGVPVQLGNDGLHVEQVTPGGLRPLAANVAGCPDVVPVLAVLCALAPGESTLYGAPHLRGKESDRIAETAGLLRLLGRQVIERADGLQIHGRPVTATDRERRLAFDAGRDHRLVMAAAVARWAGFDLTIHGQEAVEKSFPEFRSIAL